MNLRKFKNEDAVAIAGFIHSERDLKLWSANRYNTYPLEPEDIIKNYIECENIGMFIPLTLEDENGNVIGHITLRHPDNDTSKVRLGFIIVDSSIRGKGYGKYLIKEVIRFIRDTFGDVEINLGVFTNNENAYNCYLASGFEVVEIEKEVFKYKNEKWDIAEMKLKV